MSLEHRFLITAKVVSEPKIRTNSYGSEAGFAIVSTDGMMFYGSLKLRKPNRYTKSDGSPLYLEKGKLITFYGIMDGYLKDGEQVPTNYNIKLQSSYEFDKGKPISLAFGTGTVVRVGKLPDTGYTKMLVKEAKKKMKPTDEVKYRYYTLMVPDEAYANSSLEDLKAMVPILVTWSGKLARCEKLLGLEEDRTKPAQPTFLVSNLAV